MEENISQFVRKHLELLFLEREETLNNTFKDLSPVNLHNLERNGEALKKLTITNIVSNGPDRFQIDLGLEEGLPLEHNLSSGDLIICIRSKEKKSTIRGIIIEISENTLSISANEQYKDIEEDEHFTVIKTDSDFTYRAQTRAIQDLENKELYSLECLNLVKILFSNDQVEVNHLLTLEDSIAKDYLDSNDNLKFTNQALAKDQKFAVELALKRKHLAIIQGPPGTGKTTTLIEIIVQLHKFGKKILVCAPTNVAVDNLVLRLGETEAKPLRLGHPTRIAKCVQNYSLDSYLERDDSFNILKDIKRSIRDLENNVKCNYKKFTHKEIRVLKKEYRQRLNNLSREILCKSSVVLCTLNSSSCKDGLLQYVSKDYFDVLIVDESSQALEASMWIAIPNAPKLILAGDINQLPPVVMCQKAVNEGLNVSLMERAIKKLGEKSYIRLTRQYRMNEKIMLWSSKKFYNSTLEADESVKNHLLVDLPGIQNNCLTSESLVYIDTCGCECEEYNTVNETSSKGNLGEAVVVEKVVMQLIKAGLPHQCIGVITPYALQVDFIQRSFASKSIKCEVCTVDGFQGREKEVIILSLVRSNDDCELGFVTDYQRLNVAVTRARRLLIIICNSETMEKNDLIVSLLKHMEEFGLLQTAEEYLNQKIDKEIESFEKNLSFKPKTKESVKKKVNDKKEHKVTASKSDLKSEQTQLNDKAVKAILAKKKGLDVNSCLNRKTYNIYEKIAPDQTEQFEKAEGVSESPESSKEDIQSSTTTLVKHKKGSKKFETKAKEINKEKTNDFEEVVQEFAKSNSLCSFDGCKKSTTLIKLICEFCKRWYCLEHGLQEVHGCGNAIRRKEQKAFRQTKPEQATDRVRHKFSNKLKELEDSRKVKQRSTKHKK